MNPSAFKSVLAERLQAFKDMRRALGREARSDHKLFRYLDRFLAKELKRGQSISRELVFRWIERLSSLATGTRINRLSILRQFSGYMSHFDPRTYIIPPNLLPRRTRPKPYIYSRQEVRRIMRAARRIGPPGSLRPAVIATLLGLLYAMGLRVGEALKLTLGDVDLKKRVLLVRRTKFHKDRYVPISPSTARALAKYLRRRKTSGFDDDPRAMVFVNPEGRSYGGPRICAVFLEIVRRLGLRGPQGTRGPRIHDFRHSFAVGRLSAWYRQGAVLGAKLPLLTTYLGHTTVTCTETYLQATAELLEQANRRFRRCFPMPLPQGEQS